MRTTIDSAGRLVIPAALRAAVGLARGGEVEVREREGVIEVEPAPTSMHLEEKNGVLYAVADEPLPTLTADEVREHVERSRR